MRWMNEGDGRLGGHGCERAGPIAIQFQIAASGTQALDHRASGAGSAADQRPQEVPMALPSASLPCRFVTSLRRRPGGGAAALLAAGFSWALIGCSDPAGPGGTENVFSQLECSVPDREIVSGGVPPDGIPSLQDPPFVGATDASVAYLRNEDRVMGLYLAGQAWAIPHNVGWWHEIVNMSVPGGPDVAASYCPLTGSSLAFDRNVLGGESLGVSGLLFRNNLIMFDRTNDRSLWFQMARGSRCGSASGTPLPMVASWDLRWDAWREMHPDTRVVTGDLGMGRDYTRYPYGNYEQSPELLINLPGIDDSRFVKERVLGVPEDDGGGVLFPFGALRGAESDGLTVAHDRARGSDVVVFWEARAAGAMAYRPQAGGQTLTLGVEGGEIRDSETGSVWRLDGLAVAGPLAGERLEPVADAFTAFWFAWRAFYPESRIWEGDL